MDIDIRVMELLASRMCHDLISPVSAINNGVELIQDIGGDVVDEAMKLIGDSAQTASYRLRYFRMAYGRAGAETGLPIKDVRQTVAHYLTGGKISLIWKDEEADTTVMAIQGMPMAVLNVILLAEEILAYGGTISVSLLHSETQLGFKISTKGRNTRMSESSLNALHGKTPITEITPRSVQSFVTGRFAEQFDLKIACEIIAEDAYDMNVFLTPISENKETPTVV